MISTIMMRGKPRTKYLSHISDATPQANCVKHSRRVELAGHGVGGGYILCHMGNKGG